MSKLFIVTSQWQTMSNDFPKFKYIIYILSTSNQIFSYNMNVFQNIRSCWLQFVSLVENSIYQFFKVLTQEKLVSNYVLHVYNPFFYEEALQISFSKYMESFHILYIS